MSLKDVAISNFARKNFNVTNTTNPALNYIITYAVVAGGGSGGGGVAGSDNGGGGGAGGYLTGSAVVSASVPYTITVGAGGTANGNGSNSSITFTANGALLVANAVGGGGGGSLPGGGAAGGSGGGGASASTTTGGAGTSGQGNAGGSSTSASPGYGAGGGGGATAVGVQGISTAGGNGGAGANANSATISVTAATVANVGQIVSGNVAFAGGGGGSSTSVTVGTGGIGGGGTGSAANTSGNNAITNTGGGGGGTNSAGATGHTLPGGNGGSGVVILSYPNSVQRANGGLVFNDGANTTGSVSFSGTGRLTVPANTNLDITGDFTIEMWVNATANTGAGSFDMLNTGSGSHTVESSINIYNSSKFNFQAVGDVYVLTSTTVVQQNTWYHLAVTRQGTTARLFVNGNLEASNTTAFTVQTGYPWYLGDRPAAATNGQVPFSGWISNFRAINGTALYTANFTPPKSPLTAVANTTLLACQDSSGSTYHDNSSYNWTISSTGQTITALQPISSNVTVASGFSGANASGGFATSGATTYYHVFKSTGTYTA